VRYGVLSDIHANAFALRRAIDSLERQGVDGWIVPGDIVGYGAQPNECVELVADLDAVAVAGNHDLLALDALPDARMGSLARRTTDWTCAALSDDSRAFLAALPRQASAGQALVTHGGIGDVQHYVATPREAREQLRKLPGVDPTARVLVVGHTHQQLVVGQESAAPTNLGGRTWALADGATYLVNTGSVGQSRQYERVPKTRFGLLDLTEGRLELRAEDYDVAGSLEALDRAGLPSTGVHLRPSSARVVSRSVRRRWRTRVHR